MPRGGKRPGAGRPSKRETNKSVETVVAERIDATIAEFRKTGLTQTVVDDIALTSIACLYHAARRGNIKAAMFLADRTMGDPTPAFAAQVQDWTPDQVEAEYRGLLKAAGLSEQTTGVVLAALCGTELPPAIPAVIDTERIDQGADEAAEMAFYGGARDPRCRLDVILDLSTAPDDPTDPDFPEDLAE